MNLENALASLAPFISEHRHAEEEARLLAAALLPSRAMGDHKPYPGDLEYIRKNVFSILFLAVYQSLGIGEERRKTYALINHSVRGIVTATDNLLDDEDKEILPLVLPPGSLRFTSVMNILLLDRVVEEALCGLPSVYRAEIRSELMTSLFAIGEVEAEEESGLTELASPEEITSRIHGQRGGNLLGLAFIAPIIVEEENRDRVRAAAGGVRRIGLALQMIDDVVDLAEDARDFKNNYLLALLVGDPKSLALAPFGWKAVYEVNPEPVKRAVNSAIGEALGGFQELNQAGFPLSREAAARFISALFELRGGGDLLLGNLLDPDNLP